MILEAQRQSHKQKQRGKKKKKKKRELSAKYHTSVVSLSRGGEKHGAVPRNEADRDLLGKPQSTELLGQGLRN